MNNIYKGILGLTFSLSAIALGAQPALEWGKRYNAPPDQADEAMDLVVDASGNVYVTGTVFNSAGNLDICTIKYDGTGTQLWVRNYDRGVAANDYAASIALDVSGNVYVTGTSFGTSSSGDLVAVKYDNAGTELWASFYNDPWNLMDEGRSIVANSSGLVFVCGYSSDSASYFDALTVCFNSSGVQQWAQVYDGVYGGNDELVEIVMDASSNVYVTGNTSATVTDYEILTIKYNSLGVQQWLQSHGSPVDVDFGKAIALDANNNVLVASRSGLAASSNWFDYLVVKYNSSGVYQWEARYNSGTNKFEDPWDICADNAGCVYITGQSQPTNSSNPDATTVKYSPNGSEIWERRYDGGFNNSDDRAYAVVVDDTANVYIAGYSKNASNKDFITVKYDSAGTQEYALRYNSQHNQDDQANAIAVQNGNIYVTGKSANIANEDYLTIKYSYAAVGVQEMSSSQSSIIAYPNPTSDVLQLNIPVGTEPNSAIQIVDMTGRIVQVQSLGSLVNSPEINMDGLAAGTYFLVHVNADGETLSTQRIVKK